jgi:hypothetical protein
VYGTIRPLAGRSFVELLGRRFDVTEGEVVLAGPPEQARLQVLAEYRPIPGVRPAGGSASGVIITTRVAVDSGRISVDLGSRPAHERRRHPLLPRHRQARGDRPHRDGRREQRSWLPPRRWPWAPRWGRWPAVPGRRLGFDVVQIPPGPSGSQTLVAGKYVSPPLYLGFRQPIVAREEPGQTQTARTTMEWEVEYDALRRALLNVQPRATSSRLPPAPAVTAGVKCLLALGLLLSVARGAVAQDSLIPVRRDAQVTSVGFRFAGTSSFSDGELGAQLAVKGRGSLYPVRRWLGDLP